MLFQYISRERSRKSCADKCSCSVLRLSRNCHQKTAFSKEPVDMRIPFQWSTEGMRDADKAGNKVFDSLI